MLPARSLCRSVWASGRCHLSTTAVRHGAMIGNPYVERFKQKAESIPADHFKKTTGLAGLWVSGTPHRQLRVVYGRLLRVLGQMPADYPYRVYTEQLVKERLARVESEPDAQKLEQLIGMGHIEEVIQQAEYELESARALLHHKAWLPLVEAAPKGQWSWPVV